ncbi:MAG: pyridoxal-dependent decarboxylase [Acidobacteria bacterium]|nr:pyridoxal-dependent decarboxylase [Acidobacteriota bacterium]
MDLSPDRPLPAGIDTPCFLIDEEELSANLDRFLAALGARWPRSVTAYSLKANALPWLLAYFRDRGLHAEAASDDEYRLALAMGYPHERIIYNGPCKTRETFFDAVTGGAFVNLDSGQELLWLKELDHPGSGPFRVGIRANIDLEARCPGEFGLGTEGSRFGFCHENGELGNAVAFIRGLKRIRLEGLHLHLSSRTRSLAVYRTLAGAAGEIAAAHSLDLSFVNLGGGFFGGLPDKPSFDEYFREIAAELGRRFDPRETTLVVEPGTSLVSSPFSYVTEVTDVKRTVAATFAVTDGSRVHIDPLMRKSGYFFEVLRRKPPAGPPLPRQVISGFTCMEFDRLFVLRDHPELSVGDRIVYHRTGGYTLCLSPMFIKHFPAVAVRRGKEWTVVRGRPAAEDFIRIHSA